VSDRPPLYGLRVAALGVVLATSSVALLLFMFRTTLGPFTFLGDPGFHGPTRVGVWASGDRVQRAAAVKRWRQRLGTGLELVALEGPIPSPPERADLLIWDGAVVNPAAVTRVARFVKAGGSAALLGIRESDENDAAAFAGLAALWGSGPLHRTNAYLWRLGPGAWGPLRAGLSLQRTIPLRRADFLYSLDDARTEVRWGSERPRQETIPGAAWRAQVGAGRIAWLGARPDDVLDRSDAHVAMDALITALIAWLRYAPFAELIAPSPGLAGRLQEVRARLEPAGPRRFELAVSQRGVSATPEFRVRIHLNRAVGRVDVSATTASGTPPRHRFRRGSPVLDLDFPGLAGGESRLYYLDLAGPAIQTAGRKGPS